MLSKERYKQIQETTRPQGFLFNLTDACNLRCYYCFVDQEPHRMTKDILYQSLDFVLNTANTNQPISIDFFGGEPMLEYDSLIKPFLEDFYDKKLHLKYNINFGMTTNGTLLTEDRLKFLSDHRVGLLFSIDGDKESQDYNRPCQNGSSSFDLIKPNIPIILKYYPDVTFRSTVTPFSVDKMVDNYLFAKECGFRHIYMTPNSHEEWTMEQRKKLIEGVLQITTIMQIDHIKGNRVLYFNPVMKNCCSLIGDPPERGKDEFTCGWGTTGIAISTDGKLFGCQERASHDTNDPFYIGNIWNGIDEEKHRKLLTPLEEKIHVENVNDPDYCEHCLCKDYCSACLCQAHAEWNTGELTKKTDVECVYDRALFAASMFLINYNKNDQSFLNTLLEYIK